MRSPVMLINIQPTGYLSQPVSYTVSEPSSSSVPVATAKYASNSYTALSGSEAVTVAAIPYQPQQQRTMYITVPQNAVSGQSFSFSAPTGQVVQVREGGFTNNEVMLILL